MICDFAVLKLFAELGNRLVSFHFTGGAEDRAGDFGVPFIEYSLGPVNGGVADLDLASEVSPWAGRRWCARAHPPAAEP